jgi:hypothetical protein
MPIFTLPQISNGQKYNRCDKHEKRHHCGKNEKTHTNTFQGTRRGLRDDAAIKGQVLNLTGQKIWFKKLANF